ncbi:tetraspanin [Trametes coccinea BRFM310]|uniref:Tetraspanin n=1 Tax=Trametes coccinea (strain BRFM310) TaxID=1353009 RepID=A0A1Y2INX1_TRAC3|nr:tetraspanin [Trametes coccinea BRFM310]
MPSKRLMGAFAFVDFCLLVAGVILIVFSELWRMPNLLLNFTLSNEMLTGGLVLGIFFLLTFVLSVGAVVQKNHVTMGFVLLNWMLIADAIVDVVVGSYIWFFTLGERAHYFGVYSALPRDTIIEIQDKFQCCGYFTPNDTIAIGGSFCKDQATVANLTDDAFRCVTPLTAFTDFTLNNIFSTIYGFMAIIVALFLASMCVIKKRQEEERFKKIDAKRGGRGFV